MTKIHCFSSLSLIFILLLVFVSYAQTDQGGNKILNSWTLVDTMENSFGPASSLINPLAYDFGSDALILVHRGSDTYAQNYGEIWYNMSTDRGITWSRITEVSSSLVSGGRYPSAAILNPENGGLNGTAGVFTWGSAYPAPQGFGIDEPLGSGSPQAAYDSLFLYAVPWTDGQWAFWAGETSSGYTIARTIDFSTFDHIQVLDNSVSVICLGGTSYSGVEYLGFIGKFPDPDPGNPIYSGYYPAYMKSTDSGQTWGDPQVVDFRTIPALSNYDRLFDYLKNDQFISYTGDINVDKDGFVHLIISVTDTTVNNNTGINAVVEVFETSTGWDGKVIYEGIGDDAYTNYGGPAMHQMGPCSYLAFDENREQMACVWVSDSHTSSLGLCDIYISWRNLGESNWTPAMNLTQTDDMNENGAHLAPQLYYDMNSNCMAFAGYFYQLDYYGPVPDSSAPAGFWVTAVNRTGTGIGSSDTKMKVFELLQNYPNPFNPITCIQYVVGSLQFVTLKVFDMLGNEVAKLVNEEKPAGIYTVKFDGSGLSSGVYFYQIRAGDFTSTKKLILIK